MDKDQTAMFAAQLMQYGQELLDEKGRNKYTDAISFAAGMIQGQEVKIRQLQRQIDQLTKGQQ